MEHEKNSGINNVKENIVDILDDITETMIIDNNGSIEEFGKRIIRSGGSIKYVSELLKKQ